MLMPMKRAEPPNLERTLSGSGAALTAGLSMFVASKCPFDGQGFVAAGRKTFARFRAGSSIATVD